MKIARGDCGHIKARLDNHQNCLSCSSCSRLSTCSTCSRWTEETWVRADRCRTYSARRSVMTMKKQNKKKRLAVNSDPSDDNSFDGSTTPQSYTARGKTHQGGDYSDAEYVQSVNPSVTGHQSRSTRHRSTSHWSTSHRSTSHWSTSHQSTSHWSTRHWAVYHWSTRHQSTSHWSLVTGHPVTGHSLITRHQSPDTGHLITRHQSPVNQSPDIS